MSAKRYARALRRAAKKSPALTGAYRRALALYHRGRVGAVGAGVGGGVRAGDTVWIFGSGRSGST